MPKPILAFMQNMWLLRPDTFWMRYNHRLSTEGAVAADAYRLEFIRRALFYRCITGQRLEKHFGEDLIEQTVFEESTREVGDSPRQIFKADLHHMRTAIALHEPKLVVTFGNIAGEAIESIAPHTTLWSGKYIRVCHPAARQVDTVSKLKRAAEEIRTILNQ